MLDEELHNQILDNIIEQKEDKFREFDFEEIIEHISKKYDIAKGKAIRIADDVAMYTSTRIFDKLDELINNL